MKREPPPAAPGSEGESAAPDSEGESAAPGSEGESAACSERELRSFEPGVPVLARRISGETLELEIVLPSEEVPAALQALLRRAEDAGLFIKRWTMRGGGPSALVILVCT